MKEANMPPAPPVPEPVEVEPEIQTQPSQETPVAEPIETPETAAPIETPAPEDNNQLLLRLWI